MQKQNEEIWKESQKNELKFFVNTVNLNIYKDLQRDYIRIHKNVLPLIKPDISVLDVCCGPSSVMSVLCEQIPVRHIVGVDSLIDKYLPLFKDSNNVQYIKSRAEQLPFKNNNYDIAVCINALDHTQDWRTVLSEIVRVVKPYGKIYLDFEQTSYFERLLIKWGWKKHLAEHHIANLYVSQIIRYMQSMGAIAVERIKYDPWFSLGKAKVFLNLIFSRQKLEKRPKWERSISSVNLPLRKKIIHYFIHLYNYTGFLLYKKPHAYFVRILFTKGEQQHA